MRKPSRGAVPALLALLQQLPGLRPDHTAGGPGKSWQVANFGRRLVTARTILFIAFHGVNESYVDMEPSQNSGGGFLSVSLALSTTRFYPLMVSVGVFSIGFC